MFQIPISYVCGVDYEDNGVAGGVVALPELAERVLAANVPDLEIHVWQGDGRDILADCWDGF